MKHNSQEITIKVKVDECIADEIEHLNNVNKIQTLFSCCGHGRKDDSAYIYVEECDIRKMLRLGYRLDSGGYTIWQCFHSNDAEKENAKKNLPTIYITPFASFAPKSVCKCKRASKSTSTSCQSNR
jgi:hypothetical protein